MAELAIKGHKTRGNEIIEILKMLGANNTYHLKGNENYAYYVNECGEIRVGDNIFGNELYIMFTLEEFLEKYPYKPGDKVNYVKYNDECPSVYTIQMMWWNGVAVEYLLALSGFSALAKDLQPYKEETMEETDAMNHTSEINLNHPVFKGCNEIELIIPNGWEFERRGNKMFGVRKQYSKTYEECCKIKRSDPNFYIDTHLYSNQLGSLYKLLICRDAYWKIAGEQMGLDKPWEPENPTKHYIFTIETCGGVIIKNAITSTWWNRVLVFPTEKMRDAFYENFKELIEECKEFL